MNEELDNSGGVGASPTRKPRRRLGRIVALGFIICAVAVPILTEVYHYLHRNDEVIVFSASLMGQVLTVPPWHELYFQCGVTEGCLTGGHYYDEAQVLHPPLDLGLAETICENLNIVSPTPFMITLVFLLVAWLVWRRSGKAEQEALAWEGMEAANRCDGCKVTFHNFYGLARVEGKEGYFCENCRTAMAKAPAAATDE